jgi:uncharacterized RDD family membrane protein YckC
LHGCWGGKGANFYTKIPIKKIKMESQNNFLNELDSQAFEYASAGQRFLNYFIDVIAFYLLSALIGVIFALIFYGIQSTGLSPASVQLLFFFLYLTIIIGYYTLFEGSKGKTLGKLITKTRVVTTDGGAITYKQAFMRSLCRLVPFEPFSAFMGLTMWHDQWTSTMVVKDK